MDDKDHRKSDPAVAGLSDERHPPLDTPVDVGRRTATDLVPGVPEDANEWLDDTPPDRELSGPEIRRDDRRRNAL